MKLIDTHSHLYADEFAGDIEAVMERAKGQGLSSILLPAIDSATHDEQFRLEERYPEICRSMMGLHPCSVKQNVKEELAIIEEWLGKRQFIAIGEIGLDFYWDLTFKEEQYSALHIQLEWAKKYDLPVSIHSRNATDECIAVVKEHQDGTLRGVFHCFSGTQEQAEMVIEAGMLLGIGGVLTFKNAGVDKAIKDIALGHLVLETDSPYLAPVPYRGKRNESGYTSLIAQKLADVKQISLEELAEGTTNNAQKLFGL